MLHPIAFAIVAAGPTMAAEVPIGVQQPATTLVFSWTGWYVGAFVGGASGGNAQTSDPCNLITPSGCWLVPGGEVVSYPMSASLTGGLTAGFNYQIPGSSIMFGFETEFGALRLKGSSSFAPVSSFSSAPNLVANTTIGPWYNATTGRVVGYFDCGVQFG